MKIPFSIKYRPQIESGEYKVETNDHRPVRIICWNKNTGGLDRIVALVAGGSGQEKTLHYTEEGLCVASGGNKNKDLFIITPEPELSEFEVRMREIRALYVAMQEQGVDDRYGDALSANLPRMIKWITDKIELAKREREFIKAVHTGQEELTPFENGVLKMIDDIAKCITYPNNSCIPNVRTVAAELLELAKAEGKAEALKDLPRWNKSRGVYSDGWINDGFLYYKNHSVQLSSLEKLPGFKEDEK